MHQWKYTNTNPLLTVVKFQEIWEKIEIAKNFVVSQANTKKQNDRYQLYINLCDTVLSILYIHHVSLRNFQIALIEKGVIPNMTKTSSTTTRDENVNSKAKTNPNFVECTMEWNEKISFLENLLFVLLFTSNLSTIIFIDISNGASTKQKSQKSQSLTSDENITDICKNLAHHRKIVNHLFGQTLECHDAKSDLTEEFNEEHCAKDITDQNSTQWKRMINNHYHAIIIRMLMKYNPKFVAQKLKSLKMEGNLEDSAHCHLNWIEGILINYINFMNNLKENILPCYVYDGNCTNDIKEQVKNFIHSTIKEALKEKVEVLNNMSSDTRVRLMESDEELFYIIKNEQL
eukprot:TRINITY_DN5078_c0_g2_i2.p1 TRINITY_DN5078_c0_g2~~TRINITY_DN5078_c0_g2_i2.p1  ORF type:complete len:345 (-),score=24.71 TRINITY_DN5078_c0_g2_i2:274-1308(-)